jgi:hypothetical protein
MRDTYLKSSLGLIVIHLRDSDVKFGIEEVIKFLRKHPVFEPPRFAETASEYGPPYLAGTPPEEGNFLGNCFCRSSSRFKA